MLSIVIVGSGWAGFTLTEALDLSRFTVTVISPSESYQCTPLLASAACGLVSPHLAQEPVRRRARPGLRYYRANVTSINFEEKSVACAPLPNSEAGPDAKPDSFSVKYDIIILAPGSSVATFGIPGVLEHSHILRTVQDARRIQSRLTEVLELASLPSQDEATKLALLKIRIVGGGAIGMEAAAELYDLWHNDLRFLYPELDGKLSICIHDVAESLLTTFDKKLGEYAANSLRARDIEVRTGSRVSSVTPGYLHTAASEDLPFGLLIWATGNTATPLVKTLDLLKTQRGMSRLVVDSRLRLHSTNKMFIADAYGLGDAADIEGNSLPTLAGVAIDQARHIAKQLNLQNSVVDDFSFSGEMMVANLGNHDGVIGGAKSITGKRAWLAWRSGSLRWTRSWRRRIMIALEWLLMFIWGRDLAWKFVGLP